MCLSSMSERLESKVNAFLSHADQETIHDIRTTSRRIQAYADLLPKGIRKKSKLSLYLTHVRALFKSTTPIRDIDVVESKLQKFETNPDVKQILDEKKRSREDFLKVAYKAVNNLKKVRAPRFKTYRVSESKLSKRKRKVLRRYRAVLARQLKLASPTIEQLHEFRKNCKMLRYSLEVDSKKNTLMSQLVKIQGDLGIAMDVHATLTALSTLPANDASSKIITVLKEEEENANADYVLSKSKLASSIAKLSFKDN